MSSKWSDEEIAYQASCWSIVNGMVMALPNEVLKVTHCPFTLQPTPFPSSIYEKAQLLSKPFNTLVERVARDFEFLHNVHKEVIEVDPFTKQLVNISKTVHSEGLSQPRFLGIHRSDYMLHESDEAQLKQVEINTISISFGALSSKACSLHQFISKRFLRDSPDAIVQSESVEALPKALATAFELNNVIPDDVKSNHGVVLFIVQEGERNIADQKLVELGLFNMTGIPVIRMSLEEIHDQCVLDEHKHLHIGDKVVVVAYYRAGYTPKDYDSNPEKTWAARLNIERSTSIKCPSIDYHLAGTKKVQQELYNPEILKKYVDPQDMALIQSCFAPQYSILEGENEEVIEDAKKNYGDYVLKPQREGGGNLVADEELKNTLHNLDDATRKGYILMKRLRPRVFQGSIVRNGKLETGGLVAELGIFGLYVGDPVQGELYNRSGGYLLRSKLSNFADGGVAAGVAALDALLLV